MKPFIYVLTLAALIGCKTQSAEPATQGANTTQKPVPAVQGPAPVPTDSLHLDFGIPLLPVEPPMGDFTKLKNQRLMLFYFSTGCPHCQEAFPHVQSLADELKDQGIKSVAIASSSNSPDDVKKFMAERKGHLPVFIDKERQFSKKYGTGSVPLIFLIKKNGVYKRISGFEKDSTVTEIKGILAKWPKHS